MITWRFFESGRVNGLVNPQILFHFRISASLTLTPQPAAVNKERGTGRIGVRSESI